MSSDDEEYSLLKHPFPESPCGISEIDDTLDETYEIIDPEGNPYRNTLRFYNVPEKTYSRKDWDSKTWEEYFSDRGLQPYTIYYREPKQWHNQIGVLIPKNLDIMQPIYIHLHIHGGGFWTGDWRFGPWWQDFWFRHAIANNAIILAPNYILHPYGDGVAIAESGIAIMKYYAEGSLWTEIERFCPGFRDRYMPENLLVSGDSAGGWLAAYFFLYPVEGFRISALCLQYGMLAHYNRTDVKAQGGFDYMGQWMAYDESAARAMLLHERTKKLWELYKKHGKAGSTGDYPGRAAFPPWHMGGAAFTSTTESPGSTPEEPRTIWQDIFQGGINFKDIIQRLQDFRDGSARPTELQQFATYIWIYHGRDDKNVPLRISQVFKELVECIWGSQITIRLDEVPGRGHGFDYNLLEADEKWLLEGLDRLTSHWKQI